MNVILVLSLFWIGYGIVGLVGFQHIPTKYKEHTWTKDYIHKQGITWIILGLPWFGFYLVRTFLLTEINISTGKAVVVLILLSIPALIGSIALEKKYKGVLSAEEDNNPIE